MQEVARPQVASAAPEAPLASQVQQRAAQRAVPELLLSVSVAILFAARSCLHLQHAGRRQAVHHFRGALLSALALRCLTDGREPRHRAEVTNRGVIDAYTLRPTTLPAPYVAEVKAGSS